MTAREIKRSLVDFICRNFMIEEDEFEMDRSLVDQGVIDSLGLIEISTFLSRTFGFEVGETDLTRDNFGSVDLLVRFVQKKLQSLQEVPMTAGWSR
jgi:acyl carrier protein